MNTNPSYRNALSHYVERVLIVFVCLKNVTCMCTNNPTSYYSSTSTSIVETIKIHATITKEARNDEVGLR